MNLKKSLVFLALPAVFAPTLSFGAEQFDETDFKWDPFLDHYKRIIIAGVNRIARENPNCEKLDPKSLEHWGGTPDDPEFVVTCGEPGHTTHAYFTKTFVTGDPASDVPLEEKENH